MQSLKTMCHKWVELFTIMISHLPVHARTQASIVGTETDSTGAALPGGELVIVNMRILTVLRTLTTAVLFFVLVQLSAFAQQSTIEGIVTDQSGAVLPNVQVAITNEGTGQTQTLVTNGSGNYLAPNLLVGVYTVKGTASGFKTFVENHLPLDIDQTLSVDLQMEPGSASVSITVKANAEQVQKDTNDISFTLDSKQMANLDTNGRNEAGLIVLTPGVTTSNADFQLPTRMGSFSVNGGATGSNVWLLDGAEFMDRGSNGPGMVPSIDALSEFKMFTSNYSADYAFGSGGTVDMEIKTGTQSFHGGLWEYFRNDDLDANNYFSNLAHTAPPELRFNTFGGNLGGPLFLPGHFNKDRAKTFFFLNLEDRRYVTGAVINDATPTTQEDTGNFSDRSTAIYVPDQVGDPAELAKFANLGLVPNTPFPGNIIPASLIDPMAKLWLSTNPLPPPNSGTQYISNANTIAAVFEDIVRIDHTVNDKMKFDVHQTYFRYTAVVPASSLFSFFPSTSFPYLNTFWTGSGTLTNIFRPNLVNVATFDLATNGLTYKLGGDWQQPSGWNLTALFPNAIPKNELPTISIGAPYTGTIVGSNYLPGVDGALNFQERDDLVWTKGRHNIKFGGSFNHFSKNMNATVYPEGSSSFTQSYTSEYNSNGSVKVNGNSLASFLLGLEGSWTEAADQPEGRFVGKYWGIYGMDDWHILPRLTLNLGVRWDGLPYPIERNNQAANFIPADYNPADAGILTSSGSSISPTSPGIGTVSSEPGSQVPLSTTVFYLNGLALANRNGIGRQIMPNHWTDVQPRVGLAYDIFGNGKTVLRSGAGFFSQENTLELPLFDLALNPPFVYSPTISSVYFDNPSVSTLNGSNIGPLPILLPSVYSVRMKYAHPQSLQFSLNLQQQLNQSSVLSVAYVGNAGWHEITERSLNYVPSELPCVLAGTCNANLYRSYQGYNAITEFSDTGNLHYNSLQATYRLNSNRGYSLGIAYTYAHAMTEFSGVQSDPLDPRHDYGTSALDVRQILMANYIVPIHLPNSWSNALVRQSLGGWQISGITQIQTGLPINPAQSTANDGIGAGTPRPDLVKPLTYSKTRLEWFNTSAFAIPPNFTFGTSPINCIKGPGRDQWSLGLFKTFGLTSDERIKLQFRADAYNAFNHTQFSAISASMNASNFGQATAAYDPRVFQLSLRLDF